MKGSTACRRAICQYAQAVSDCSALIRQSTRKAQSWSVHYQPMWIKLEVGKLLNLQKTLVFEHKFATASMMVQPCTPTHTCRQAFPQMSKEKKQKKTSQELLHLSAQFDEKPSIDTGCPGSDVYRYAHHLTCYVILYDMLYDMLYYIAY